MSRPYTDIAKINNDQPIKNGSVLVSTMPNGEHLTYDKYVKNIPAIDEIYNKYGYRFYNGIFVELVGDSTIVGA